MRKRNMMENVWVSRITFYVMLTVFWQFTYLVGVDLLKLWKPYSFPSPLSVGESLFGLIRDNILPIAIASSLMRVAGGYLISVVAGFFVGMVVLYSGKVGERLSSLFLGLQTLPSICWVPFAILWYGLNESAIIFVIVVGSMFSVALATESSIRGVNPLFIRVAKNAGANRHRMFLDVVFPAALPGIIAGLKQGWSFAWRSLMAGEMMTATLGLGQVLMLGRDLADISQVVAVMLVIVLLGLAVDSLIFGNVEKRLRIQWGVQSTAKELL